MSRILWDIVNFGVLLAILKTLSPDNYPGFFSWQFALSLIFCWSWWGVAGKVYIAINRILS